MLRHSRAARTAAALALVSVCGAAACATRPAVEAPGGPPSANAPRGRAGAGAATGVVTSGEMQRLYRGMGLIAGAGAIPFVASVSFLSTPSPDTTLVLLALSLPPRALSFAREGDRYTADYVVKVEARRAGTLAAQVEAKESVRVPTFRETSRTDESIIWQQVLRLTPGRYALGIGLRDESAMRTGTEEASIDVPRLAPGQLATPMPVYEVIPRSTTDSLPRLLARPRATVTFGADSQLPVYIEAAGAQAPSAVLVRVLGDSDTEMWRSTVELTQRQAVRSATVPLPVTRLGVGVSNLEVTAVGGSDTARTRLFVSLGEDLPIASFEEMLTYLRYFVPPERLKPLREATVAQRAERWSAFLRETDPLPGTAEHEGLRDYFLRIRMANVRFREDGPIGWQTDRGTTYVALGDPDNIYDSALQDPSARVRQQIWEYRSLRLQLVFTDQTGFGRYRLNTAQRGEVEAAIRRKLAQQQP